MTDVKFLEDGLENIFLKEIQGLGYRYAISQEILQSTYKMSIAEEILKESLTQLNSNISLDVVERAIYQIRHIDANLLVS